MSEPAQTSILRLVTETNRVPDSFKFERRREPRHRLYARVTAMARPDRTGKVDTSRGEAGQICALELFDQSDSGLGAWSVDPISMGARVTVFFPAYGNAPGYNAVGRVVRCVNTEAGYSIGLQLESQVAAA